MNYVASSYKSTNTAIYAGQAGSADIVIRQRETLFTIITLLTLCGLLTLSLVAGLVPSSIYAFIALGAYAFYALVLASYAPFGFILLLPYIFLRATVMLSGIAIETGGYMYEITMEGAPTGAFLRLSIWYIFFIYVAAMVIQRMVHWGFRRYGDLEAQQKKLTSQPWYHLAVMGFLGLILLVMAYVTVFVGLRTGFPLITGMDRFTFRDVADDRMLLAFLGNRLQVAGLLGLVSATNIRLHRVLGYTAFFWLVLLSALCGEKFTSLLIIILTFIAPLFLLRPKWQSGMLRRLIPVSVLLLVITIPLILASYGYGENSREATEKFQNRVISQGQIWYLADRETDDLFRFSYREILHNVRAALSSDPVSVARTFPFIGVHKFMYQAMPSDRLYHFWEKDITITMGFDAYLLSLFGWGGMVFPWLMVAAYYGALLGYLGIGVQSFSPVRVILAGRLLGSVNFAMTDGLTWFLFGPNVLIVLGIIGAYEYWRRVSKFKRVVPRA